MKYVYTLASIIVLLSSCNESVEHDTLANEDIAISTSNENSVPTLANGIIYKHKATDNKQPDRYIQIIYSEDGAIAGMWNWDESDTVKQPIEIVQLGEYHADLNAISGKFRIGKDKTLNYFSLIENILSIGTELGNLNIEFEQEP